MNIPSPVSFRNPDLQALFIDPTPKQRTACPLCVAEGHDTGGNNLSIGDGCVHCFRDPAHGDKVWHEIRPQRRNGIESLPPEPPAADDDPWGELFDDHGNACQQDDGATVRQEVELLFATYADDLDALPEAAIDRLLSQSRFILFRTTRVNLEATFAAGRLLKHQKSLCQHGQWTLWLENKKIDPSWAARAMKVASRPWSEIQHHNSCGAVLAEMRETAKKNRPSKREIEAEARDQEIEDLKRMLDEARRENPTEQDMQYQLEAKDWEIRMLKNRNVELVREGRRKDVLIAKLEASKNALNGQICTDCKKPLEQVSPVQESQIRKNTDLPVDDWIPVSSPMPAEPKELLPWVDAQPELKRIVNEFSAEFADFAAGSQYPDD